MADTAYQRKYRSEFIAGFEKRQSLARHTVTTEAEVNGNEAIFLVADSGSATAVTRGVNGDIPTRPDNLNQYTATLKEWHDVPERTGFNLFASQGDGRRIMQMTSMAVLNRKIDDDIHTALATGTQTQDFATSQTRITLFSDIREIAATLGENNALDTEPFALITPAFYANLLALSQFTSVDYINIKPFENVAKSRAFNWMGMNWIVDSGLPGVGTATASCYFYNKAAIGHACDTTSIKTLVGYDEKNDKSWARCTAYMGSKLLQNSGVIVGTHDDTTIVPHA
jgi:hypothetical protein